MKYLTNYLGRGQHLQCMRDQVFSAREQHVEGHVHIDRVHEVDLIAANLWPAAVLVTE